MTVGERLSRGIMHSALQMLILGIVYHAIRLFSIELNNPHLLSRIQSRLLLLRRRCEFRLPPRIRRVEGEGARRSTRRFRWEISRR